jgi:uncharacterized protein (TIGR03118 family)
VSNGTQTVTLGAIVNIVSAAPPPPPPPPLFRFTRVDLVSDRPDALLTDSSLVNAWGLQFPTPPDGFWIANRGSSTATLYLGDAGGSPMAKSPLHVDATSPTGVVVNSTAAFPLSGTPATLIFATESGTIRAWRPGLGTASVQVASKPNAVYKGLAIANNGSGEHLYAADFHNGTVDVYDTNFAPVTLAGSFVDPTLPAGYAPLNIFTAAPVVVVAYGVQDPAKHDPVSGAGNGLIDVFSRDGILLNHFIPGGGALNAPWGMAIAQIADPVNNLLVANMGDGRINVFNVVTGALFDALRDRSGNPIVIDGLRGITIGNSSTAGDGSAFYFTAGPNGGANGVFGKLVPFVPPSNTLSGSGAAVSMTEGASATVTVAAFADANAPGTYAATINWGDGSTSAGTIVANGSGTLLVRGTHAYAEEAASNLITTAVSDSSDGGAATFNGSAAVADAPLTATGTTILAVPAIPFSGIVASFIDADPAGAATDYTASIDWGDGSSSSGAVSASGSGFTVAGAHTYASLGPRTVTVTIADSGGATASARTQALVIETIPAFGPIALLVLAVALAAIALVRC